MDDSVLISKKAEHAIPKMVRLKSKSSLDLFQKLVAKEMVVDAVTDALKKLDEDDVEMPDGKKKTIENKVDRYLSDSPSNSKRHYPSAAKVAPMDNDNNTAENKALSPPDEGESIV